MMMAGFAQKRLNRFGAGPRIQRWSSSALMALSEAGKDWVRSGVMGGAETVGDRGRGKGGG